MSPRWAPYLSSSACGPLDRPRHLHAHLRMSMPGHATRWKSSHTMSGELLGRQIPGGSVARCGRGASGLKNGGMRHARHPPHARSEFPPCGRVGKLRPLCPRVYPEDLKPSSARPGQGARSRLGGVLRKSPPHRSDGGKNSTDLSKSKDETLKMEKSSP